MRFLTLSVIIFINIVSCRAQADDKAAILKTILNSGEFKNYHHADLKNRTPLYVLDNEQLESLSPSEIASEFKIVEDTSGTNGNYVKLSKLTIENDKAEFTLYYKIENVEMSGYLRKKDNKWEIEAIEDVIEF